MSAGTQVTLFWLSLIFVFMLVVHEIRRLRRPRHYALRIHLGPRWTWHSRWRAGGQYMDTSIPVGTSTVAAGRVTDTTTGDPVGPVDAWLTWASSDEGIFTVEPSSIDTANVAAVAAGTATLSAQGAYLGHRLNATAQVTVTEVAPHTFALEIQF